MAYTDHFHLADDYIMHLDTALSGVADPFIKSQYIGFLAVSAVTVYELAIKDIFIEFAEKKHKVLGNFARAYFDRINGQIGKKRLVEIYIPKYGDRYAKRFEKNLDQKEREILRAVGTSVKSSYGNIIVWRNKFAHEGVIPSTPTYEEVKDSYTYGKYLIDCLAVTMTR